MDSYRNRALGKQTLKEVFGATASVICALFIYIMQEDLTPSAWNGMGGNGMAWHEIKLHAACMINS